VLGAYKRGVRIISVTRLRRLAGLPDVPTDELLPSEPRVATMHPSRRRRGSEDPGSVTIGLVQLDAFDAFGSDTLVRYVRMIQRRRKNFDGRAVTLRDEDVRVLGRICDLQEAGIRRRLGELGVRL